jgi:hypothetical protein
MSRPEKSPCRPDWVTFTPQKAQAELDMLAAITAAEERRKKAAAANKENK